MIGQPAGAGQRGRLRQAGGPPQGQAQRARGIGHRDRAAMHALDQIAARDFD